MQKSTTGHKVRTLSGLVAGSYLLMVFPGYLQTAAATEGVNSARWFACIFTLVFAAGNFIWFAVTALQQLDNALTKHKPPNYTASDIKPSRFSIYFSVATVLGFVVFMLPLGIRGLVKAIKADNALLIASSMVLISLAVWASIKHVVTLKKGGVKGWIHENTRLRKV